MLKYCIIYCYTDPHCKYPVENLVREVEGMTGAVRKMPRRRKKTVELRRNPARPKNKQWYPLPERPTSYCMPKNAFIWPEWPQEFITFYVFFQPFTGLSWDGGKTPCLEIFATTQVWIAKTLALLCWYFPFLPSFRSWTPTVLSELTVKRVLISLQATVHLKLATIEDLGIEIAWNFIAAAVKSNFS